MKKLLLSAMISLLALGSTISDAEAKRLGGGRSIGMQRQATPQQAAPSPAMKQPAAAPQAAPTQPKRNWMGPLAGLAAGLGIAALLSHFGLGEGVANFLMIALLAFAVIFALRWLMRRSQPQASEQPLQYAGIGGPNMAPLPASQEIAASGATPSPAASPLHPTPATIPADFDSEGFLRVAKVNFVRLQAANDAGNLDDIRAFTSPEMFAEIKLDIDERKGAPQQTDVVTLEAELLEVVTEGKQHIAAVRFRGMLREEKEAAASAFDEVWTLAKPVDGNGGWVLAGISQLT